MEEGVPKQAELSKNAIKRQIKKSRQLAGKVEWKRIQKEKRKMRKTGKSEGDNKMPIINTDDTLVCGQIAIDLGFLEQMTDKETRSLALQIMRCYALNRRFKKRFKLILVEANDSRIDTLRTLLPNMDKWDILLVKEPLSDFCLQNNSVYLSADAPAALDGLSQDITYIIGGLVDHNRLKGICFGKADSLGIPSLRLPIADNVVLSGSKILTVVNVYEVLLNYLKYEDWKTALEVSIPKRKQSSRNEV